MIFQLFCNIKGGRKFDRNYLVLTVIPGIYIHTHNFWELELNIYIKSLCSLSSYIYCPYMINNKHSCDVMATERLNILYLLPP